MAVKISMQAACGAVAEFLPCFHFDRGLIRRVADRHSPIGPFIHALCDTGGQCDRLMLAGAVPIYRMFELDGAVVYADHDVICPVYEKVRRHGDKQTYVSRELSRMVVENMHVGLGICQYAHLIVWKDGGTTDEQRDVILYGAVVAHAILQAHYEVAELERLQR